MPRWALWMNVWQDNCKLLGVLLYWLYTAILGIAYDAVLGHVYGISRHAALFLTKTCDVLYCLSDVSISLTGCRSLSLLEVVELACRVERPAALQNLETKGLTLFLEGCSVTVCESLKGVAVFS